MEGWMTQGREAALGGSDSDLPLPLQAGRRAPRCHCAHRTQLPVHESHRHRDTGGGGFYPASPTLPKLNYEELRPVGSCPHL